MTSYLMVRLYGPMASWGDIAVGEQRSTQGHPSKSAVFGLLAAALGIKRDEEEKQLSLMNGYSMAVRVDSEGALLRDYHTIQVPPPQRGRRYYTRKDEMSVPKYMLNTLLSQRDYRVDAHYTVAIFAKEAPYSLAELEAALKTPRYTLYLGRKSCPLAFPLQPQLIDAENLQVAFETFVVDNKFIRQEKLTTTNVEKVKAYYWEDVTLEETGLPDSGVYLQNVRRDQSSSRRRWQFVNRMEHFLMVKEG